MTEETLTKVLSTVDNSHTFVIDEFNRCTTQIIKKFVELTKSLSSDFRIFVTSNPGYAGRNPELALIKPVTRVDN